VFDDQMSMLSSDEDTNQTTSSLTQVLTLARQSLGETVDVFIAIPSRDRQRTIIARDQLNVDETFFSRVVDELDGVLFVSEDSVTPIQTMDQDGESFDWFAAEVSNRTVLIALAPAPWDIGDRERALLRGFADLTNQFMNVAPQSGVGDSESIDHIIADAARDGILSIDTEGYCRYINQTAAAILGISSDEALGQPVSTLVQIARGDQLINLVEPGSTALDVNNYDDVLLRDRSGKTIPVDLSVIPSQEPPGAVIRIVDLREQKATLAAFEETEARHRAFLNMTLDSIVTIDSSGQILELNLAAEKTFRALASNLIGASIGEILISPQSHDWWEDAFRTYVERNDGPLSQQRVRVMARRADGSQFPADLTMSRIPMQDSWVYSLYIHDVSEIEGNERRRGTRYAITHILAEDILPADAIPDVLVAICQGLGWDWAAYWTRKPGSNQMEIELIWSADDVDAAKLERVSRESGFQPGDGFLGDVWTRQSTGWIEDLCESNNYHRSDVALECGFQSVVAMPITGRTEITGIIEFHSRHRRPHDPEMARMLQSVGSQIGQFIERKQIEEERAHILTREQSARAEAEAAERRLAFLAEASAQLSTSLDYEVTLSNIVRLAVPQLADYCAIDMLDEHNQVWPLELADVDPEKEAQGRQMHVEHPVDPESNHPVAQVLRSGRPILYTDVDDNVLRLFDEEDEEYQRELREIGIDSAMYVPLIARGQTIGVVSFVTSESGHRYSPSDLALAQELTRRAAMAIDNALLYREAQEAVRVREEFLSIASHELKTPLTTVKGYSQILGRMLRREELDKDRLTRLADQLQEQLSRFETLIADLLDVSRIQQRGLELRPEPTDLVQLTRMVVSRFEYPAESEPGHTFTIEGPAELNGIWDPDRLDQVLTNLISNAVKYSPDGGDVRIEISMQPGDFVELAVCDEGIGIPEDEQAQLFRPFARSETVQRAINGVGLGLYISQQIVNRHGGVIWLESEPGEGSRFVLQMPRDFNSVALSDVPVADPDEDEIEAPAPDSPAWEGGNR
jgi:PAS domain S-box-containing protein